jgi:mRNA interferase RelE/StbE
MYKVVIARDAADFIRGQTKKIQRQLYRKIYALGENPFPSSSTKLKGHDQFYRIHSGPYRIVYTVKNEEITVLVLRVAHRKEVYRRL